MEGSPHSEKAVVGIWLGDSTRVLGCLEGLGGMGWKQSVVVVGVVALSCQQK